MRSVGIQLIRICVVLAVLVGMTIWHLDFVALAVGANPALNLIIFGTCLFGFTLVFNAIRVLFNEYKAYYFLVETYDDLRNRETAEEADPLWRYYRCRDVAIVFNKPQVLGQSFQMIADQLLRDNELKISPSTMQALNEGIDERLQEMKSLMSYVAGILVLLGLIGTFLGLMITLASVGDILGGLDLTSGDPTETVSNLMGNLKTPLGGMATGFSSSLFGLVTSLTTSLMIQLVSQAGGSLKADVSDWLTNVVQLHDVVESGEAQDRKGAPARIEERRLALLMKAARHTVTMVNAQRQSINKLSKSLESVASNVHDNRAAVDGVAGAVSQMIEQNRIIHLALSRSVDALNTMASASNMRAEVAELTGLIATQIDARDARQTKMLQHIHKQIVDLSPPLKAMAKDEQDAQASDLVAELKQHTDELNITQLNKLLAAMYSIDGAAGVNSPAPRSASKKPATLRKTAGGARG